jgi:hypothetical protein
LVENWVEIEITESDREVAKKLGNGLHKSTGILPSTRIFTQEAGMQDYIGQLGQLKFHHFLTLMNIKHQYHTYNSNGKGDFFDFEINGKLIDVDTAHNHYGIPDEKLHFLYYHEKNFEKFDFVVGIMLNNELTLAKILGFLMKDEIKKLPLDLFGKTKARYCNFNDLHPIQELLNPFKNKGLRETALIDFVE